MPADDPIWGDVIGNPSLEDGYWGGSVPFSHLGMKGSVQWLEIVLGVKVRIYKKLQHGVVSTYEIQNQSIYRRIWRPMVRARLRKV